MKRIIIPILLAFVLGLTMPACAQDGATQWTPQKEQQLKEAKANAKNEKDKLNNIKKNQSPDEHKKQLQIWKAADKVREDLQKEKNRTNSATPNPETATGNVPSDNAMDNVADMNIDSVQTGQPQDAVIQPTEPQSKDVQDEKAQNEGTSWWMQLLAMLGVAGVCSGGVFVVMNNKLADTERKLKAQIKTNKDELSSRLSTLIDKTDRIETSVGSVRRDVQDATNRMQQSAAQQQQAQQQIASQQSSSRQELFLSMPGTDGSWKEASTKKTSQSFYHMITDDGVTGRFQIINERYVVQTALMTADRCISPVCRIKNVKSQVSGIVTDEPGIVVKENGVWRVKDKAVAHYV